MSRTPSTNLNAQLVLQGAQPGFLVSIRLNNLTRDTLYLCSLDVDFPFGGFTWLKSDILLTGMSWQSGGDGNPTLTLGDAQLVYWAYAAAGYMADSFVNVWLCYAGAPNEAEPLWRGNIGGMKKLEMALECALQLDGSLKSSPRRKVQDVIPPKFLLAAGTKILIGGQTWVLGR